MTVKEFKAYLEFYKDEQEVIFKLPSGQAWNIDEQLMFSHNLKDQEKREECKLYLK